MPDNKLTDNEIIKALECCIKEEYSCNDCLYECDKHFNKKTIEFDTMPNGMSYDQLSCDEWLKRDALELINRLQAQNEVYETCNARKDEAINSLESRLKKLQMQFDDISKMYSEIKAEAYKEFAERLKEKKARYNADNFFVIDYIPFKEIDNTLKELVGDK